MCGAIIRDVIVNCVYTPEYWRKKKENCSSCHFLSQSPKHRSSIERLWALTRHSTFLLNNLSRPQTRLRGCCQQHCTRHLCIVPVAAGPDKAFPLESIITIKPLHFNQWLRGAEVAAHGQRWAQPLCVFHAHPVGVFRQNRGGIGHVYAHADVHVLVCVRLLSAVEWELPVTRPL